MVKGRMRKENGNSQHEPETNANNDDGASANSPMPPSCAPINQTQDGRHDVTPRRKTEGVVSMTQNEAHAMLTTSRACCKREVRRKCRLLARKYYPDKWCEECNFTKAESEEVLKNILNTHALIGRE